jgi:poly-beta-1,6-N-acetyl-D-glucosamine synthase
MIVFVIFITFCLLIFYAYLGYPLLLAVLARWASKTRKSPSPKALPAVTIVFCAHNEASVLAEKIINCRSIDYPSDHLEFCVGSDGSTDETNALLQSWADQDQRVRLTLSAERVGKTMLLNRIVPTAKGEIVLFSDASTLFPPDAVRQHVSHYADPAIGCVGGDLVFTNTTSSAMSGAHGAYWRYERYLRQCESSLGTLGWVAGANYSMRRALWQAVPPHFADDCNSPLNVIEQGYRVVYDPDATAREVAAETSKGLMRRRIRMVTRDLEALLARPALLNPLRSPGIAWSIWSHKILRWFVAPLLVFLLITNLFLLDRQLFQAVFALQLAFYMVCLAAYFLQGKVQIRLLSLPLYFALSNLAALFGLANVIRRKQAATWQTGGMG